MDVPTKATTNENRWYLKTIPQGRRRSQDAYIRERMRRKTAHIDQVIRNAINATCVEMSEDTEEQIGDTSEETLHVLSGYAGKEVAEALIEETEQEGGLGCDKSEAMRVWTPHAQAHALEWLEQRAPASHWDVTLRALVETKPNAQYEGLALHRLTQLAQRGPRMAENIRACDPWVAREICWRMIDDVLDEDVKKWVVRVVQMHTKFKMLRGDNALDDQDALLAVEHWRWPTMRPPLEFIALSAGKLPPIRSDSAWANAIRTPPWRTDRNEQNDWVQSKRKSEDDTMNEAISTVSLLARHNVHTKKKTASERIIALCQRYWAKSAELKGDGRIGQPRLEAVGRSREQQMMWVFEVHGPETLLAGCTVEGKSIEQLMLTHGMNNIRLAMTLDGKIRSGKILLHTTMTPHTEEEQKRRSKTLRKIAWWTTRGKHPMRTEG